MSQEDADGKLELTATRKEFTLRDESGYRFDVVTVHDPETGWSAYVTLAACGFQAEGAALAHLEPAADRFLRMLRAHTKEGTSR